MPDNVSTTVDVDVVYRDEMREFLLALRRALLQIVRYIERRYGVESD